MPAPDRLPTPSEEQQRVMVTSLAVRIVVAVAVAVVGCGWCRGPLGFAADGFVVGAGRSLWQPAQRGPALAQSRMPPPLPSPDEQAREVLLALLEEDEVDSAPSLVAPHIEILLQSDLGAVARRLEAELEASGSEFDRQDIADVTEFVVRFLEEVVTQATEMHQAHARLLRAITEAAQASEAKLDELLLTCHLELDSTFVAFLDGEIERLRDLPLNERNADTDKLTRFMTTVAKRVRAEIEAIESADGANLAVLLGLDDEQRQRDSIESMIGEHNVEGLLRLESMLVTSLGDVHARAQKGVASTIDPDVEQRMLRLLPVFERLLAEAKERVSWS